MIKISSADRIRRLLTAGIGIAVCLDKHRLAFVAYGYVPADVSHLRHQLSHARNVVANFLPTRILKTFERLAGVGMTFKAFVDAVYRVGSDNSRFRIDNRSDSAAVEVVDDIFSSAKFAARRQNVNYTVNVKNGIDANRVDAVRTKRAQFFVLRDDFFQNSLLAFETCKKFFKIFIGRNVDNLRTFAE